jgi:hypothetical protein
MEFVEFNLIVFEAFQQNCYTKFTYNGETRNTYPFSFRDDIGGIRMFAWCDLHAYEPVESFYVERITNAMVGDPILFVPQQYSELAYRYSPESY